MLLASLFTTEGTMPGMFTYRNNDFLLCFRTAFPEMPDEKDMALPYTRGDGQDDPEGNYLRCRSMFAAMLRDWADGIDEYVDAMLAPDEQPGEGEGGSSSGPGEGKAE